MCGISGFADFNKTTTAGVLEQMNRSMAHRGPDGEGYAFFETGEASLGFGHRRLSIIDLSEGGRQPMQYGQYTVTFNGEIYNYQEIKQELVAKGHQFLSSSDTEVILHAFAEWGKACVHRFIGMFAFAIFDSQQQRLTIVRDRAGIKPLFYYYENGLLLFASELKAFHCHPGFKKQLNHSAVAAFLQYGNIPAPYCIFNNTYKLPPAHILELNLTDRQITTEKYWNVYDAYNQPKLQIGFEEAVNETENLLQSAFEYRMVADVPVGVFLSGGYDSTSVAAILQKNSTRKIKTFTIGVGDDKLNEAPFAKATAEYLGTEHYEYYCTEQDALSMVNDLPFFYDEPFGDSSAIPTMLVSKMARQEVTVALSADAGDECFAGYNRHQYLVEYGKKLDSIPGFAKKAMGSLMDAIPAESIPVLSKRYNFANRYDKLKGILKNYSEESIMLSLSQQYADEEVKKFLVRDVQTLSTLYTSGELKKEFYSPLSYIMAIDYQTYLADDILQKVDRATMAFSLEGREPFLDHRVIEWAARLPDNYKYNKGIKKYILKEIVHKYVPESMMKRPKMGFAIPVEKWLQQELKPLVDKQLSKERIHKDGILNFEAVKHIKESFYSGKTENYVKLWYLLMFQMWYEKWMH
jgi:asparagine synthase (glutamine-hydrolysing)